MASILVPNFNQRFIGVSCSKSSTQSINNATWTVVTFNTEQFDTNNFHDNSSNTSRITIPTGRGGYYLLSGTLTFASNATGARGVQINKNGSQLFNPTFITTVNGFDSSYPFSLTISLVGGDYVEVLGYQNSGGALNLQSGTVGTLFQATYLGA